MTDASAKQLHAASLQDAVTTFEEGRGRRKPIPSDIAARLLKKYGGGDKPHLRKKCFRRIAQSCDKYGWRSYKLVRQAAVLAEERDYPDRYFIATCVRMLEENEMWDELSVL